MLVELLGRPARLPGLPIAIRRGCLSRAHMPSMRIRLSTCATAGACTCSSAFRLGSVNGKVVWQHNVAHSRALRFLFLNRTFSLNSAGTAILPLQKGSVRFASLGTCPCAVRARVKAEASSRPPARHRNPSSHCEVARWGVVLVPPVLRALRMLPLSPHARADGHEHHFLAQLFSYFS